MKLYCLPPAILIIIFCSVIHVGIRNVPKREVKPISIIIERLDQC